MPDVLYRYDEPTSQWVIVTSVNRIEVSGGGGGLSFINLSIILEETSINTNN